MDRKSKLRPNMIVPITNRTHVLNDSMKILGAIGQILDPVVKTLEQVLNCSRAKTVQTRAIGARTVRCITTKLSEWIDPDQMNSSSPHYFRSNRQNLMVLARSLDGSILLVPAKPPP